MICDFLSNLFQYCHFCPVNTIRNWQIRRTRSINPFPNGKILDLSKFKAFADDKINVSKKKIFVLGRVENTVGNGETAGYRQVSSFPMFSKACFTRPIKTRLLKTGFLTHYLTVPHFDILKMYSCGKHCEKNNKRAMMALYRSTG